MKITSFVLLVTLIVAIPFTVKAEIFFFDGWESNDMSATNADGFSWYGNNKTSVVTMDPHADQGLCTGTETGANAIWNNGAICNGSEGADWTAKNGRNSLRFRYGAGAEWTEQKFNMGTPYPELWIRYWLRVPVNYLAEIGTNNANNHKFLALWTNGYEMEGATVMWEMRPLDGGPSSKIYFKKTGITGGAVGGDTQSVPFISVPGDRGRWMQVVFRVQLASSAAHSDGVVAMWRRWEGEASYTQLHYADNINIYPSEGEIGFRSGYILGWANAPYAVDTEWLVDDFTLSTTSLLDSVPVDPPAFQNKPARIRALNQPATISTTKQPVRVR